MREATTTVVRREDYAAPAYFIRTVDLSFDLDPAKTIVGSQHARSNATPALPHQPLRLHGEELTLLRVLADGQSVSFRHEGGELVIDNPPDADLHAGDPQHLRARQEHRAVGPVHQRRRLLHAVRGRRASAASPISSTAPT